MQRLTAAVLMPVVSGLLLVSAAFAEPKNPTVGLAEVPGAPLLFYSAADGSMRVEPADPRITTWEMQSTGGKINCDGLNAGVLAGLFDSCGPNKLFVLRPEGAESFDFGAIYPPGTSLDALAADLVVDGSLFGGGSLSALDARAPYLIPEPSSLLLLGLGLLSLLSFRRKRQ